MSASTPLPLRVCLIGESTAAGSFYAPHLTPAMVLEDQLREVKGARAYEVIDLTDVDMTADGGKHDLVRITLAALKLNPDLFVIFAGNNWLTQMRPFASSSRDHLLRFAPAYREAGVRGIMESCERDTASHHQGVMRNLAHIAAAAGIPTILVVPEVNHLDWERGLPVAWLSGERTSQWHALYRQALALTKTGDGSDNDSLAAIAERMITLDEGTCPISHRLLGNTLVAGERLAEAREAYIREVDSVAWTAEALPGAGSTVREVLRLGAGADGLSRVDLPEIFAEHSAGIPGRALFLDYCHLTLGGIKVAMAAVASQILRLTAAPEEQAFDWRPLLGRLPDPRIHPARDAMAKFLAAMHALHWERRFDGPSPLAEYWCEAAVRSWDGMHDLMLEYVATRVAPATISGLSVAEQRLFSRHRLEDGSELLAGEGRRLGRVNLDPAGIELICSVLERSGWSTRQAITKMLVDQHALGVDVELVNPYYHWTTMDHLTDLQRYSLTDTGYGVYQAFWPASHFCFVSDSSRDAQLNITARVPAIGHASTGAMHAAVSVNGHHAGAIPIGHGWACHALNVARESLAIGGGANKVTIHWPRLSPDGDAATRQIRERLEQGVPANLHPVFGELQSLVARS